MLKECVVIKDYRVLAYTLHERKWVKLRERLLKSRNSLLEVRKQGTETNWVEHKAGLERDWNDREDEGRQVGWEKECTGEEKDYRSVEGETRKEGKEEGIMGGYWEKVLGGWMWGPGQKGTKWKVEGHCEGDKLMQRKYWTGICARKVTAWKRKGMEYLNSFGLIFYYLSDVSGSFL